MVITLNTSIDCILEGNAMCADLGFQWIKDKRSLSI